MDFVPFDGAGLTETHRARLARPHALEAHRLAELLEHAQAYRSRAFACG